MSLMATVCRTPERHDLRVGFTLPSLIATLYLADGTPIDLSTPTTITFKMRRRNRPTAPYKVNRSSGIDILDAAAGQVRVDFDDPDVDTVDEYDAFFVLTYSDGNTLPVPNPDFIIVTVGRA